MPRAFVFVLCLLFGAGLTAALMPATAQPKAPAAACPEHLGSATSLVCACSAEATAAGTIWGADVYTDDSAICRAAVHAGRITPEGGTIWVFEQPGQASYPAVTRGGIVSGQWPAWRRSIAFGNVAEAPTAAQLQAGPAACPANAVGLAIGARLHCGCSIEAMADGGIWGSGPYTADSNICRAARHAGAIGPSGGEVSLRIVGGGRSFPPSSRNGVASSRWGAYPRGYAFD
jgi:hypothetical protein